MLVPDWATPCIDACTLVTGLFRWHRSPRRCITAPVPSKHEITWSLPEPALSIAHAEACDVPASRGMPERCMRVSAQETKATTAQQGRHVEAPPVCPVPGPGGLLAIHPTQVCTLWQCMSAHTYLRRQPQTLSESATQASTSPVNVMAGGHSLLLRHGAPCDERDLLILAYAGEESGRQHWTPCQARGTCRTTLSRWQDFRKRAGASLAKTRSLRRSFARPWLRRSATAATTTLRAR